MPCKKRGCLGRGKALGDLRQSVPQNGRVHLHIIEHALVLCRGARGHYQKNPRVRKIFVRNFLVPEMAAPILWAPGKIAFFLQQNLHVHKIPRFRGGGIFQGNARWVAPSCADCPGFLVLGSAPAPASTLVSEPQIVPLG